MTNAGRFSNFLSRLFIYGGPVISFLLLGGVLNMTSPLESGPVIILLVFVLFYVFVASVLALILHAVGVVLRMLRPQSTLRLRRWYYIISVVALAPVLFVALNTLGQLKILEISLILLLIALGCFYVLRRSA